MDTSITLPGIEPALRVLGLTYGEIAQAIQADESTLYRWRQGQTPTAIYFSRLERLDDLVREIRRTMRPATIRPWLDRPIPALQGATPKQMILQGRSETVLGMLISLNAGFSV